MTNANRNVTVDVLKPGLLTTIQDGGRPGYRQHGVSVCGALDSFAHRVANLLVGNDEREASLEISLIGPTLLFHHAARIALCGASLSPRIAGQAVPEWTPLSVPAGTRLEFENCVSGCRCYLALKGGFDAPIVMGSRSADLRAGIGGMEGRALQSGDVLTSRLPSAIGELTSSSPTAPFLAADWSVGTEVRPDYGPNPVIRAVRGGQHDRFTGSSRKAFFSEPFTVTPHSDRMGYRLTGPEMILDEPGEMLSEAVAPGTVQITRGGQPILLLADGPTTGGYPKIAHVITVDLPLLAQLQPGDTIRFAEVTVAEAQRLHRKREANIQRLQQGIRLHER